MRWTLIVGRHARALAVLVIAILLVASDHGAATTVHKAWASPATTPTYSYDTSTNGVE